MQLLRAVEGILQRGGLGGRVWMRPYHILCCGPGAGLIEMVADCASIDQVKKRSGCEHLGEYFTRLYGPPHSPCLEAARRNFLRNCRCTTRQIRLLHSRSIRHRGRLPCHH